MLSIETNHSMANDFSFQQRSLLQTYNNIYNNIYSYRYDLLWLILI